MDPDLWAVIPVAGAGTRLRPHTHTRPKPLLRLGTHFRKLEKGRIPGEALFAAYGRSAAGRYLIVLFIFKRPDSALPISARDMTAAERRYYVRKR